MSFVCRNCTYYGEGDWSQCRECLLREEASKSAERGYNFGFAAGRAAERADVLALVTDWESFCRTWEGELPLGAEGAALMIERGVHLQVSRERQAKREAFMESLRIAPSGTRVVGKRWFDGACLACGAHPQKQDHSPPCPFGQKSRVDAPALAPQWPNTFGSSDPVKDIETALENARSSETAPKPVCDTCKDTHWMYFGEDHDDVMCTRCPVPCEKCRSRTKGGGGGPFCAQTPCACDCHAAKTRST